MKRGLKGFVIVFIYYYGDLIKETEVAGRVAHMGR
jgi:hypothetical protein